MLIMNKQHKNFDEYLMNYISVPVLNLFCLPFPFLLSFLSLGPLGGGAFRFMVKLRSCGNPGLGGLDLVTYSLNF